MVKTAVDPGVVGGGGGCLDHVGGGDLGLGDRDRGQWHPGGVRGVTGGPDGGVRRALEVAADAHAALAPLDAGGTETQVGEVGDAARAVDDEIGLDRLAVARALQGDPITPAVSLDSGDGGGLSQVDPDLTAAMDQELDEIGVETLQRALAAVDDDGGAADAGGEVGELEGDQAAPDEQDPRRQGVEVQEVGAVDQVLVAGEVQGAGTRAGGDEEAVGVVGGAVVRPPTVNLDLAGPGEARVPVKGVDVVSREPVLNGLGGRVGEAVLVLHQIRPVDRQPAAVDALAVHQAGTVDDLGSAAQDLLRVTPP